MTKNNTLNKLFEDKDFLLFDFDGTIANTHPLSIHTFQLIFKEFDNIEYTDTEILAMYGDYEAKILEKHLKNQAALPKAIHRYYELYFQDHEDLVKGNPIIEQALMLLHSSGKKMAIVTGKERKTLEISLDKLGLRDYFSASICGDEVSKQKPNPESIEKILEKLDGTPDKSIMIGDTNADIRTAKAANILSVGVHWFQPTFFSETPDVVSESPKDLLDYFQLNN